MILLNEFYIDKLRGHPTVITTRVNADQIVFQIYMDEYLEPKIYKCTPGTFEEVYIQL